MAQVPLNDTAAPVVRARVTQSPKHATQRCSGIGARRQFQFDRIESYRIGPRKVAAAVDKAALHRTTAIRCQRKAARRHGLGRAGQRDIDKALCRVPRSHWKAQPPGL